MTEPWKLIPEEIEAASRKQVGLSYMELDLEAVALAAQKKLLEWGDERCRQHTRAGLKVSRLSCSECRQALYQSLGVK